MTILAIVDDYADIGRRLARLRAGPPWYEKPPLGPAPVFVDDVYGHSPAMTALGIASATIAKLDAIFDPLVEIGDRPAMSKEAYRAGPLVYRP